MQRNSFARRGLSLAATVAIATTFGVSGGSAAQAAETERFGGSDRIATGLQVFEQNRDVFSGDTAVIAGTGGFADALTAAPLAAAYKGPVLSTQAGALDAPCWNR